MADSKSDFQIVNLLDENEELIWASNASISKSIFLCYGGLLLTGGIGTYFAIQFNLITVIKGAIGAVLLVLLCIMGIRHNLCSGTCVTSKRLFQYTNHKILRSFSIGKISDIRLDRVNQKGVGTISFCISQEQTNAATDKQVETISIFDVEEAQQVLARLANRLKLADNG